MLKFKYVLYWETALKQKKFKRAITQIGYPAEKKSTNW